MDAHPSRAVPPEVRQIGPYTLHELIGRGGMGSVYRATAPLGATVALKLIREELLDQPEVRRRFTREARTAARLDHPNICRLLDFGTHGRHTFMVMELVRGGSLKRWRQTPPDGETLLRVVADMLSALGYAHARGVVHRDLKPENVLLDFSDAGEPIPKILDFGVAHMRDDAPADLRNAAAIVGTPAYMSPEQALRAVDVSPAADLYAIGVMLFEFLSGALPFIGKTTAATLMAHLNAPIPRLVLRDGYSASPELEKIVRRLLAKHPSGRYLFAIDARRDIERCSLVGTAAGPLLTGEYRAVTRLTGGRSGKTTVKTPERPDEMLRRAVEDQGTFSLFHLRESPFVGRDREFGLMQEATRTALSRQAGGAILVHGEAGGGKTRLVQHIREFVEEFGWMQAWSSAYERGGADPLEALRHAIRRGLGVVGMTAAETEQRINEVLRRQKVTDSWEQRAILELVTPDLPKSAGERVLKTEQNSFALVERILRRSGRTRPVMLILENVHLTDGAPLRLLEFLLSSTEDAFPFVIVLTYRPEGFSTAPRAVQRLIRDLQDGLNKDVLSLSLSRLTMPAIIEVVRGCVPMDDEIALSLAARAGGNPMLAVELVRHMVETGKLEGFGEAPTAREVINELPSAVSAVVATRLEEAAASKYADEYTMWVWELLAVVGQRENVDTLKRMAAYEKWGDTDAIVDRALTAGVVSGILTESEPGAFRFEPSILRDALLDQLREQERYAVLNERAAEVKQVTFGDRIDERAAEIARHYEASGQPAEAFAWFVRQGRWSSERHAHAGAVDSYGEATRIGRELALDSSELVDAWLKLAEAQMHLTEYEEASDALESAEAMKATPGQVAKLHRLRAEMAYRRGNARFATEEYEAALEVFEAEGDLKGLAQTRFGLAQLEVRDGKVQRGEQLLRQCRADYIKLGNRHGEANATWALGRAALDTGLIEEAGRFTESAQEIFRQLGDRHGVAVCDVTLGEVLSELNEWREAVDAFERAREELLAVGDRHSAAQTMLFAGIAERGKGRLDAAKKLYAASLLAFEELGDRRYAAMAQLAVAQIEVESGSWERARSGIEYAMRRDEEEWIDDRRFVSLLVDLGRAAIMAGQNELARRVLESANFKLERTAYMTSLYDRVDEVQYLLHELSNDEGLTGEEDLRTLFDDDV